MPATRPWEGERLYALEVGLAAVHLLTNESGAGLPLTELTEIKP
jgi:hypothetical protein